MKTGSSHLACMESCGAASRNPMFMPTKQHNRDAAGAGRNRGRWHMITWLRETQRPHINVTPAVWTSLPRWLGNSSRHVIAPTWCVYTQRCFLLRHTCTIVCLWAAPLGDNMTVAPLKLQIVDIKFVQQALVSTINMVLLQLAVVVCRCSACIGLHAISTCR